jgi:hypothetical protein
VIDLVCPHVVIEGSGGVVGTARIKWWRLRQVD